MPKVVVKCIESKGKVLYALCFCPEVENVRDRVIVWGSRNIAYLTDLRCSEIQKLKVGEVISIC